MANAHRTNRNIGPNHMTDKKYRELARATSDLQEYFISVATEEPYIRVRHAAWLNLIGLIETSDII